MLSSPMLLLRMPLSTPYDQDLRTCLNQSQQLHMEQPAHQQFLRQLVRQAHQTVSQLQLVPGLTPNHAQRVAQELQQLRLLAQEVNTAATGWARIQQRLHVALYRLLSRY